MRKYFIFIGIYLLSSLCRNIVAQDINTAAAQITQALGKHSKLLKNKTVRLDYFTFQNTAIGSEFSLELDEALRRQFKDARLNIRENPTTLEAQKSIFQKDQAIICGVYSEKEEKIVVSTLLYIVENRQSIPLGKTEIAQSTLKNENISWKSAKIEQERKTRNLIVEDEESNIEPSPAPLPEPVPVPESNTVTGDFKLEVMTNKGWGHQIFTEGERMQIAVKSEKPCFLRLVYHAADGNKVLLLENEPMKTSEEGNFITVPQEFECSAPFGMEMIQLFACTEIFPPLRTHKAQGFIFIDDEIAVLNQKTRGFKPVSGKGSNGKTNFEKAETHLQITTLAKK